MMWFCQILVWQKKTGGCLRMSILTWCEGCSNMNASSFITFFTCMLQQYSKRFYKRLYVTFKLAPDQKKNTVYLSSYGLLNEGHVSILTNSILRTYTSDKDERLILRYSSEISWHFWWSIPIFLYINSVKVAKIRHFFVKLQRILLMFANKW